MPFIYALLILIGALVFILALPVRLCIKLRFSGIEYASADIRFHILHFIRPKLRFRLHILKSPAFTLYLLHGKRERMLLALLKKPARAKRIELPLSILWDHLHIRAVTIEGELGMIENAAATALLCGALISLLTITWSFLNKEKDAPVLDIRFLPNFQRNCFRLNLEGIAGLSPIHIIIAIVLWRSKSRKVQKKKWRILSKTS